MKSSILLNVLSCGAMVMAQRFDTEHLIAATPVGLLAGDVATVLFEAPVTTPVALVVYSVNSIDPEASSLVETAISSNFITFI